MEYKTLINGLVAVQAVAEAYDELIEDVENADFLKKSAKDLIMNLYEENSLLNNIEVVPRADSKNSIGTFSIKMSDSIGSLGANNLASYIKGNNLDVPVNLDMDEAFALTMCFDQVSMSEASKFAQDIAFKRIQNRKDSFVYFVDLKMGGNFYSLAHSFVKGNITNTGGMIVTKETEFDALLKNIEEIAKENVSTLQGKYRSTNEFNQKNNKKVPEILAIIHMDENVFKRDYASRLEILVKNRNVNGVSLILVSSAGRLTRFEAFSDFCFNFEHSKIEMAGYPYVRFIESPSINITEKMVEDLINAVKEAQKVDTHYKKHKSKADDILDMYSEKCIRIPFAVDKDGDLQYFEVGGDAPPHALLSGTTGSGKSVLLHTLIKQTILHYHPDDVEIWGIDYKAVEFNTYIVNRTPHFRVIGQDTSTEFSLSLLDLLYEEYEKRQRLFIECNVKSIEAYRRMNGKYSMPRIMVIIDEFQFMTQAVQQYGGKKDYRTILENLLRLTRAMGISFVLCSQTIASGLSGLTDSARDQIGCRLCLKHDDDMEIRETLMLPGSDINEAVSRAKALKKGQGLYKKISRDPYSKNPYELEQVNVLFIDEESSEDIISSVNAKVGNNYQKKEEIIVKGNNRFEVAEKIRHPFNQFMQFEYEADEEVEIFPAAPTTLVDSFKITLDNASGNNMLFVGGGDDLRESVILHSIYGLLMNSEVRVVVNIFDEEYSERRKMVDTLRIINSSRFSLNVGVEKSLSAIRELEKLRAKRQKTVYFWYGLEKLKSELFLLEQDEEESEITANSSSMDNRLNDLMGFLNELNGTSVSSNSTSVKTNDERFTYNQCCDILRKAFDIGPELDLYHFVIFNNNKAIKNLKKAKMFDLDFFEHRMGTKMSTDDSYELFGSSLAINKTNATTIIYSDGTGDIIPLRPYLLPQKSWCEEMNRRL